MNILVRKDVFGERLAKLNPSWAVAFFDGEVPLGWASMPFEVDGDGIYESCKSLSILRSTKDFNRMELVDQGEAEGFVPYGRVRETAEGFEVMPRSIKVSSGSFDSNNISTYESIGKSISLVTSANDATHYALPKPLTNATLEFEFDFEISLKTLMLQTDTASNSSIRDFSVEYWDATLLEGEGDWVNIGNFDHYNYRSQDFPYNVGASKSSKYRLVFTQENTGANSAQLRRIKFLVDEKPEAQALPDIVPTYCIIIPLAINQSDQYKHSPAIFATVGGPSSDADLVIDRDSYSEGQTVKLLSRFFENSAWEVL